MVLSRGKLVNEEHLELRLAEAYVPFQTYEEHYSPGKGLRQGTIFPELDLPYMRK
ncbi:spore coat associated protein CotJA [Natroniella sulfidigena]|uniref:spore coat associated protein CotJA n=1 Tax=Natroniella sulfidigena TaxID=723921 RepID=UPI00200B67BD|nr:spore coat associated protein CotJA [Natroniella sulfidigena]MCK8816706.1 spore coat associated protein CotJA [Natroniella sulfidigena]